MRNSGRRAANVQTLLDYSHVLAMAMRRDESKPIAWGIEPETAETARTRRVLKRNRRRMR